MGVTLLWSSFDIFTRRIVTKRHFLQRTHVTKHHLCLLVFHMQSVTFSLVLTFIVCKTIFIDSLINLKSKYMNISNKIPFPLVRYRTGSYIGKLHQIWTGPSLNHIWSKVGTIDSCKGWWLNKFSYLTAYSTSMIRRLNGINLLWLKNNFQLLWINSDMQCLRPFKAYYRLKDLRYDASFSM